MLNIYRRQWRNGEWPTYFASCSTPCHWACAVKSIWFIGAYPFIETRVTATGIHIWKWSEIRNWLAFLVLFLSTRKQKLITNSSRETIRIFSIKMRFTLQWYISKWHLKSITMFFFRLNNIREHTDLNAFYIWHGMYVLTYWERTFWINFTLL